jgi:hypothetical protein
MLQTCLKINRSYSAAREAIKKLQNPNQGDWYQWWFSNSKYKKIFGGTLVGIILATVTIILLLTPQGKADIIAVLVTLAAILIGLLLSPSLKRIKLADIELDIAPISLKSIELEAALSTISSQTEIRHPSI